MKPATVADSIMTAATISVANMPAATIHTKATMKTPAIIPTQT